MTKCKRTIVKRYVLTFLSVGATAFIFINSSFSAVESDVQSGVIVTFLNNLLQSLSINVTLSDFFVRKCAHFAEYFVLGTLLYFTVLSYISSIKKVYTALSIGFFVACVDEFIQLFPAGRSAQFSDVVLDFFGVLFAVLFFYFLTKSVHEKGNINE